MPSQTDDRAPRRAWTTLALVAALGSPAELPAAAQEPADERSLEQHSRAHDLEDGGATPEEVFERMLVAKDMAAMLALLPPSRRGMEVIDLFDMVAIGCTQDSDQWPAACAVLERHGLEIAAAVEAVEAEAALAYPERIPQQEARAMATFSEVDVPLFARELTRALAELGMPNDEVPARSGRLEALQVEGDRAVGRVGGDEIVFLRIAGRWYLEPTDS